MTRKDESRKRILSSAGNLMKEKGLAGTSVARVMDGAGMTVGGFYAHFPSKDDMVAEALSGAVCRSLDTLKAVAGERKGAEWLNRVARTYLSGAHRDNPTAGCPLPATAGEIANAGEVVRDALAEDLRAVADEITVHMREAGVAQPESDALAALSMMVGGLALARALAGTPLSDRILAGCREHLSRSLE